MKRFIFALAAVGVLSGVLLSGGRADSAPIGPPDGIRRAVDTLGLAYTVQHGPTVGHGQRGGGTMRRGGGHRGDIMQGGGGHRGSMMRAGRGHSGNMMQGGGHRGIREVRP
jgi:hypothetical protein